MGDRGQEGAVGPTSAKSTALADETTAARDYEMKWRDIHGRSGVSRIRGVLLPLLLVYGQQSRTTSSLWGVGEG